MKLSNLVFTTLLVLLPSSSASACDGGNLALAYLFGYNNFQGRAGVFNNYTPPYFSLHPPVYYGERYYRPYGASPFAAWPQLQPNASYAPRLGLGVRSPAMIENPHCCETGAMHSEEVAPAVPGVVSKQTGPLVIDNPYFIEDESRLTKAELH
jgi:hypothetical protein